jgi:hypothetical protein
MLPISGVLLGTTARSSADSTLAVIAPTKKPLKYAQALRARPRPEARKVAYAGAAAATTTQTRATPGATVRNMCMTLTQRLYVPYLQYDSHAKTVASKPNQCSAHAIAVELQTHSTAVARNAIPARATQL